MYCKNCEKEIEGNFIFCPHCGNSIQQEIVPFEDENEYSEKEYKNKLISLKKEYIRKKIKRISMSVNAFILFNFIILCGLFFICIEIGSNNQEYSKYDLQLYEYEIQKAELENELENKKIEQAKRIEQEKKIELANYETEFYNTILQNREKQVKSCVVSPENMAKANDYIKSLYRHSEAKIEQTSLNNESCYLIKDYIELDKYNLLDSTNNTIYPGAILKGDSLFTDNYTIISEKRTPITIMSNQSNGKAKMISQPNYSNVSTALNQYANEYAGDVSKEWVYNLHSMSTSQELNLSLGLGIGKNNLGVNLNSSNQQTTMAVVYSQVYYTVSTEPKSNVSDYFENGVDLSILGGYEPAYVSSVDYGRKIILMVSGNLSQSELAAKLNAHVKGVDIGVGIENVKKDEKLECKVICYGGEDINPILSTSDSNVGFIGKIKVLLWGEEKSSNNETISDRLNAVISNGNKLINPVPISYDLKYLSDNAPVPAMYINSEEIMLAKDAQIITLSSADNSQFQIDITALPAILLNVNEVIYENGKASGSNFELLCSDLNSLPINILYKENGCSIDLATYEMEKNSPYKVGKRDYIVIYKTKYLKHYIQ